MNQGSEGAPEESLTGFVVTASKILASRYKNPVMREDLEQEGILIGLEHIHKGVTDKDKLTSRIRTRMNDFMNLSRIPVSVPSSGDARKARAAIRRGDTQDIEVALREALMASGEGVEENTLVTTVDACSIYEDIDTQQYVLFIMDVYLDKPSANVLKDYYIKGKSQAAIADALGVTQQRVSEIIRVNLGKLEATLREGLSHD